tara:strand:- start:172 stop:624 length:453 start_codon:yes stop_codon:yes gene_type:complete
VAPAFLYTLTKGNKMKQLILAVVIGLFSINVADAQERKPIFFERVTVGDVLTGTGLYLKEVGCKTVAGTKKIIKGTGDIITSPFRSKINWPKPRMFRYERGFWTPPKLEEMPMTPPEIDLGEPVESNKLIFPLHKDIDNQEFITLVNINF